MHFIPNLQSNDRILRSILGGLFLGLSFSFSPWFAPVALMLMLSSFSNYCLLYSLVGLGTKRAEHDFLLTQLPIYNPEPVFIFSAKGDVIFSNESAKRILPQLKHISAICSNWTDWTLASITNGSSQRKCYSHENLCYQFNFRGIKDINALVAYGYDITSVIEMGEEIVTTQKEIIYTMGEIGESRSRETGNHVKRVALYSEILAKAYGLSAEEAKKLKMASPMHDIGKIGIPDSILNKPGKLTSEEWKIMRTHAQLGYDMLKHSDREIIKAAAIVSLHHHEKWDGSGYPNALSGEDIHIYGRITAVADVFDALGSARVYKEAWDLDRVLSLFQEERGKHFDPELVDLLFSCLSEFLEVQQAYQDVYAHPEEKFILKMVSS